MWTALNGVTRLVLFPKGMKGEQPGKVSSVFASGQREVLLFGMCLEKFKPVLTFPSASHVLPGARKGSREGPWEETRANRSTPAGSPRGSPLGGQCRVLREERTLKDGLYLTEADGCGSRSRGRRGTRPVILVSFSPGLESQFQVGVVTRTP